MESVQRVSVHGGHSGEFCCHAVDSLEEIVVAYIEKGLDWVGITEHAPPVDDRFRYPEEIKAGLTIFGPKGCKSCNAGYKGRVGIFQVMEVSEAMGRIIMEGGNAMQIADQATKEGVIDLRRAGLNKVKDGVTSLEEINRVTIE